MQTLLEELELNGDHAVCFMVSFPTREGEEEGWSLQTVLGITSVDDKGDEGQMLEDMVVAVRAGFVVLCQNAGPDFVHRFQEKERETLMTMLRSPDADATDGPLPTCPGGGGGRGTSSAFLLLAVASCLFVNIADSRFTKVGSYHIAIG